MALTVTHVRVLAIADDITHPEQVQPTDWGSTASVAPTHVLTGILDADQVDLSDYVQTSDARLSDARVPLAHTQAFSTITATPTSLAGYGILDAVVLGTRTVNGHALSADVTVTKSDVGLGNVENTALSTWAGSTAIVTIGPLANLRIGGAALVNAFTTVAVAGDQQYIGDGRPIGNPPGTITLVDSGAGGNLAAGTYQYMYTETPGIGETGRSAIASITVAANHKVTVTWPLPRRGVAGSTLYRTVANGATFKIVHARGGADGFFQSKWVDNRADVDLGATAPANVDTTILYKLNVAKSVTILASNPDQVGAADFGILTSPPGTSAYCMDAYGPIRIRAGDLGTPLLISYTENAAGARTGNNLTAYFISNTDTGAGEVSAQTLNPVFNVAGRGNTAITPMTLGNPADVDGTSIALSSVSTFGTANTAAAIANAFTATGAGSAAFTQSVLTVTLSAGYTGSADSYAGRFSNTSANSGQAFGVSGNAFGTAGVTVGVFGVASGAAPKLFGGFFSADGSLPSTVTVPGGGVTGAALAATNGSGTNDIIEGYDGATVVFRVKNDGDVDHVNVGATATWTLKTTTGGGAMVLRVNGGSTCDLGSSNNIAVRVLTNNVVASTFSTSGQLTVVGGFGCNGAAAQAAVVSGGALAAYVTGAFGLDTGAHMQALLNQVIAIRSALVANGIMS